MIARALPRRDTADHASRLAATVALAFAALLMLLPLLAVSAATAPRVEAASRPTIVLVHGAWAGPTAGATSSPGCRRTATRRARPRSGSEHRRGCPIVGNALDAIPGDKILVGHSYGGSVISQAAAGRADVLGLVFTAAFVPDAGETLIGLGAGYPPPAALQPGHLVFLGEPFASPSIIAPDVFRRTSPRSQPEAGVAARRPAGPQASACSSSRPDQWPGTRCRRGTRCPGLDQMIDPALQRVLAARIGATTVTFDEASHAGGYTHYAARLVKLVEAAAAATAR